MILDNKDKKRHSKKKVIFQTKKTKNEKSVISRNFIQFDPSSRKILSECPNLYENCKIFKTPQKLNGDFEHI